MLVKPRPYALDLKNKKIVMIGLVGQIVRLGLATLGLGRLYLHVNFFLSTKIQNKF
jgi:hypothetical protein